MTTEQKFKWTLAGLIVMVLLNAALLISLWVTSSVPEPWTGNRPGNRGLMHQPMHEQLGLNADQTETMRGLRRAHFQEMRSLRRDLDQKRKAYFDYIMNEEGNDPGIRDSLLTELSVHFTAMEKTMYQHLSEMKTMLTDDQQQMYREIMENSLLRNHQARRMHER